MANEFIARNGLIAQNNSEITGSLLVTSNVGIGTTTPAYKLDVASTVAIGGSFGSRGVEGAYRLKFYDNGGTANDTGIGLDGYGGGGEEMWFNSLGGFQWDLGTNGEKMRIDSTGKVGIGTTAPGYKLHVNGDSFFSSDFSTYTADGLFSTNAKPGVWVRTPGGTTQGVRLGYRDFGSGQYSGRVGFVGSTNWSTGIADSAGTNFSIGLNNAVGTDYVTIVSGSGNVGIGTSSPSEKLDVGGNINIPNGLGTKIGFSTGTAFTAYGTSRAHFGTSYGNDTNPVTLAGYYGVSLFTAGAEAVTITSAGNVGIGTTSPGYKLGVFGDAYISTNFIQGGVNTVSGNSHAQGLNTAATGQYSHAEGNSTAALGDHSHAEGVITQTGTNYAFNSINIVSGEIILDNTYGDITSFLGIGNMLLFDDTQFDNNYGKTSFRIVSKSYDGSKTHIFLTDTTISTSQARVGDIDYLTSWQGLGGDSAILGGDSHAEGSGTYTLGESAHSEGVNTIAAGTYSHAEGQNNQAIGAGSHAEGYITKAIGNYSHTEGYDTKAIGDYSHTEGRSTRAGGILGYNSTTIQYGYIEIDASYGDVKPYLYGVDYITLYDQEFDNTYGCKVYAVMGYTSGGGGSPTIIQLQDTTVTTTRAYIGTPGNYQPFGADKVIGGGTYSHAEGEYTSTIGQNSHVEGYYAVAGGNYSHAEGNNTATVANYQHASGLWNVPLATEGSFVIGDGTDNTHRHNIFEAYTNQVNINGNLTVGNPIQGNSTITATSGFYGTLYGTATTASYIMPLRQAVQITGSLRGQVSALSITSNTASLNLTSNNFFTLSLVNGTNTHVSASNIQPGQTINLKILQGSAGTGTVSFNSIVDQASGSFYTGSAIANATDIVTFISFDSSLLYMSAIRNLI